MFLALLRLPLQETDIGEGHFQFVNLFSGLPIVVPYFIQIEGILVDGQDVVKDIGNEVPFFRYIGYFL